MNKFLAVATIHFFLLAPVCLLAQKFSLKPQFHDAFCPAIIYAEVDSKVILSMNEEGKSMLKNVDLFSDSIFIRRVNDSLYIFRPVYGNTACAVYLVDKINHTMIDTTIIRSDHHPFLFDITLANTVHEYHSNKEIFSNIRRLYFRSKTANCIDYAKIFTLMSYELVLKRGDSILLISKIKDNQTIPGSFIQKLMKVSKKGDELCALNIYLIDKSGMFIRVRYDGLYRVL